MAWSSREQEQRRQQARETELARQKLRTRCLHCPPGHRFSYTGTLRDGQAALERHRARKHPELPALDDARHRSKRILRGKRKGLNNHNTRRENVGADELHEREILRRMVRSDLPAIGR